MIIEGLNVLQPARMRDDGRTGLAVSDFFDFSVYVDAALADIKRWYVERFLRLRETAFEDPQSYFRKYAALSHDEAVDEATRIWDSINEPNLVQNVAPTRGRAPPWCCARTPTTRCATCGCASSDRLRSEPLLQLQQGLDACGSRAPR